MSKTDLSRVPDEALYAEIGRRRSRARKTRSGGKAPSCTCGECLTCQRRIAQCAYRAKRLKIKGKKA